MEKELSKTLHEIALKLRGEYKSTQSQMSEALAMSERSYEEIESGRNSCGTLTAVLIVLKLDEHPELKAILVNNLKNAYSLETTRV